MARGTQAAERPIVIVRKARGRRHGAHHGGAWKVAYADFVTAMMAFFMLLWLLSNPDKEQLKGLAKYFSPAPPSPNRSTVMTQTPGDNPGLGGRTRRAQADNPQATGQPAMEAATQGTARGGTANIPDSSMRVLAEELRVMMDSLPETAAEPASVRVESSRDGVRVSLMDSAKRSMFRDGTAELNAYATDMLAKIALKLAKTGVQVAIEGHTDSAGGQSAANWRLSGERALAARTAMIAAGLTADRFTEVVAMAGTRPVFPDQPERPENRRITIVMLAEAPSLPSDVSFKF